MVNIPIQGEAWVRDAKRRVTNLFNGESLDRIPFIFNVMPAKTLSEERSGPPMVPTISQKILNNELDLNTQLETLRQRFELGCYDDQVYCLRPYAGTGTVASGFGCKTKFREVGDPTTLPIIGEVEEIRHIKPDIENAGLYKIALEKTAYFRKQVGERIPISLPDMQSPLDTAAIMMNNTELMVAMFTHPEEVHRLLSMITGVIIEMVRSFMKDMAAPWPASHAHWLPRGIWLSDDMMSVISPELYEEYGVKYLSEISREFGGVFLHSCGDVRHNLKVAMKIEGFMGLQFWEVPVFDIGVDGAKDVVFCNGYLKDAYWTFGYREQFASQADIVRKSWEDLEWLKAVPGDIRLWYEATCRDSKSAIDFYNKILELAAVNKPVAQGNLDS